MTHSGTRVKAEKIPVIVADAVAQDLYVSRVKIHPREVEGRFSSLRRLAVWVLLGIFYLVPWLPWGDRQMVLFDLPARKFYILWFSFFPQDFMYLAFFLIICALSLFLFTALAGRLWCGFACPQTVWTEVFIWIEEKIEGNRLKRQKLDRRVLDRNKILLRGSKHAVWIVFSLWTGFTFVGFFTPITDLGARLLSLDLGPWEAFWILFYSFATYGNAGWLREQVCTYMCPYARFQSAMFDKDTLIIAYDEGRGENRGSRVRNSDYQAAGLGDCIDCTLCVQVCPTGIDIRDGLQYQCIGCAACIDACDSVMDKVGYARGLVRYTTENAVHGQPIHILRTRTVAYIGLLTALIVALLVSIALRTPLGLDVIRDRNSLYRTTTEGRVENVYTLKIINMDEQRHRYALSVSGIPGMALVMDKKTIRADSGEVVSIPVRVRVDSAELKRTSTEIIFSLAAEGNDAIRTQEKARFLGPLQR